jgi:rhamnosyltransferase
MYGTGKSETIRVIVPTLNAAGEWTAFTAALLACVDPCQVVIVDSSSTDGTPALARAAGFQLHSIERSFFNHGGTRQMAADLLPDADILVYLTQDAVLANPDAISNLVRCFDSPEVGVAYGRQLPRPGAGPIEVHARLFNYSTISYVHDLSSSERVGLKAVFVSNSFSAYRRSALMAIGGFRSEVILGEDTLAAAHMLLTGWKVAYAPAALVYHSHAYTMMQEFKRYFDIGVLHSREDRVLSRFGKAHGEGKRFVKSELRFLAANAPSQIPSAVIRSALKWTAYRLGRVEERLSPAVKRRLSMHCQFWTENI